MTKQLKVLVTGVTGTVGSAVARRLLEKGHLVRGLTRHLDRPAAKAIAAAGAELRQGDLEDQASLARALSGVDALFLVVTPFEAGTEAETRQGIAAVDAATAAGAHVVYSSVANADQKTGIPHFDSKFRVEQHLRSRAIDATIVAPAYFMENVRFSRQQLREGVYPSPLAPTLPLAQVAVPDIAAVATAVLEDRRRHAGQRYDLGGDELTGNQSVEILSRVTGRPLSYFQVPMDMIRAGMGEDGVKMYEWFATKGYTIDQAALRRIFPEVPWLSFEAWAKAYDWKAFFDAQP